MKRGKEIIELFKLTEEELVKKSEGHLLILDSLTRLHQHFALSLLDEIKRNNISKKATVLILPYGPVLQYPLFVEHVNSEKISLKKCTFFFMDEYADSNGNEFPESHFLSFKGGIKKIFSNIDKYLSIPQTQLIFPTKQNIKLLKDMIKEQGGIQTCYGGIGVHGHLAFNEPKPGVSKTDPRIVKLNDFTITINCIRDGVGGDLINYPTKALTIGMSQILNAKKIRLYCRNDVAGLDWANTVLRLAVLGTPGDDYPVTHIRNHKDWMIITDKNTASKPKHILENFIL
ncbi:MAG: 6-phosphogluconolactonase [Ignavibacteriaceae bacterium]